MGLVNISVVEQESRRLLLQWKIMSVEPPDVTFSIFFKDAIRPLLNQRDSESVLKKAFVGSDKNSLDDTDINLPVVEVTKAFGQFVKLTVQKMIMTSTSLTMSTLFVDHVPLANNLFLSNFYLF